jgi:cytochrome c biogenesis protein CcdA
MIVGGLLDGINPCAFAVIVFFVSYLTALGSARREIFAIGMSFIVAVFLTYFSIGLGLSEAIGLLSGAPWLSRLVSYVVAGIAFVLALFSLYDFVLAVRGRQREIVLQLPSFLKKHINLTLARRVGGAVRESENHSDSPGAKVTRRWSFFFIAAAAFVSGIIVSFLELVCTGQIYLPAIRMMFFDVGGLWLKAIFYLLVYNLAFVVPLLGVFLLAYLGVTSEQLRGWLTRHMGATKLATAVFFAALGAIILIIEFW